MFQSLPVILMVVFTCSQSFAMLPQESSSWQREVKMAAEYDADQDINQFLWFTAGLGTTAACCLGAYIGYHIAHRITYSPYDPSQMYPPNLDILGCVYISLVLNENSSKMEESEIPSCQLIITT